LHTPIIAPCIENKNDNIVGYSWLSEDGKQSETTA
jgi:hypothetical protein